MQFQGDYAGNPPSMLKDMFKINLFKTMKKKFGPEMRHSFANFADYLPIGSQAPDFTLETPCRSQTSWPKDPPWSPFIEARGDLTVTCSCRRTKNIWPRCKPRGQR